MDLMQVGLIGALVLMFVLILALVLFRIVRRRRAAAGEQPAKSKGKPQAKAKTQTQTQSLSKPKTKTQSPPQPAAPLKRVPAKAAEPPAERKSSPAPAPKPAEASTKILGGPTKSQVLPTQPKPAHAPTGQKIRILIVDDNTGTRENVSRLLYFEDDLEVIGQAVNGREGVEMTVQLKPHIVLMDINMPDMDGITATGEMAKVAPFSQVIIMSVQADQHYMRRAMAAGARDFQPKPFTSEELVGCIRRVYNIGLPVYHQFEAMEKDKTEKAAKKAAQVAPTEQHAPVIAVYSPKGGAGTSAVAASFAVALHQEQGDTVLLDGSLQFGDVSVHLNTRQTHSIVDMIHDGELEADLIDDVLVAHNSGLKLLMAPPQPELAEAVTGSMISDVLGALRNKFKGVVADTTCYLSGNTLAILEAADCILLIITPELPAIKSAKLFLELTRELKFSDKHILVVINRAGVPGGISPKQVEKVLSLSKTYQIPDDPRMVNALARGAPVVLEDPSAPAAVAIQALAKTVLAQLAAGSASSQNGN